MTSVMQPPSFSTGGKHPPSFAARKRAAPALETPSSKRALSPLQRAQLDGHAIGQKALARQLFNDGYCVVALYLDDDDRNATRAGLLRAVGEAPELAQPLHPSAVATPCATGAVNTATATHCTAMRGLRRRLHLRVQGVARDLMRLMISDRDNALMRDAARDIARNLGVSSDEARVQVAAEGAARMLVGADRVVAVADGIAQMVTDARDGLHTRGLERPLDHPADRRNAPRAWDTLRNTRFEQIPGELCVRTEAVRRGTKPGRVFPRTQARGVGGARIFSDKDWVLTATVNLDDAATTHRVFPHTHLVTPRTGALERADGEPVCDTPTPVAVPSGHVLLRFADLTTAVAPEAAPLAPAVSVSAHFRIGDIGDRPAQDAASIDELADRIARGEVLRDLSGRQTEMYPGSVWGHARDRLVEVSALYREECRTTRSTNDGDYDVLSRVMPALEQLGYGVAPADALEQAQLLMPHALFSLPISK